MENLKGLKKIQCIDRLTLKFIAMFFMLCDHMWATIIPANSFLTVLGRIAFPIFAFQIAESCAKTSNYNKFLMRLFLFALVSEIPFNLMVGGGIFYPVHQNVMFTFLIAAILIKFIDKAKKNGNFITTALATFGCLICGFIFGTLLMVDYLGFGVLTCIMFYITKDFKYGKIIDFIGLYIINTIFLAGYQIIVPIFGTEYEISQQSFALLSLIFIWLYNGKRGKYNKSIQYSYYLFYPLHMLILALISRFM